MMKRFVLLLFTLHFYVLTFAQQPKGELILTTFYHDNGTVSSEGFLIDGKPDGYWKTYHPNGNLKSAGNRKLFELDSLWQFYDESGKLTVEINYRNGQKHGQRITFTDNETIKEYFENDVKQKTTQYLNKQNRLTLEIPFVDGLEQGLAKRYDTDGRIIELIQYKKGFITERERINLFDVNGLEHGVWKWFYENDVMKREVVFKHGVKNGFLKEYDKQGNLVSIEKYIDGIKQIDAEELARLDIRHDYYPDGKVRIEATYKNGVAEGVRREYAEDGSIEKAYVFRNGKIVAEGILSESGTREGEWLEYYPDGKLKAKGNYKQDRRVGEWLFYHSNGRLEQTGSYSAEGLLTGKWLWYYNNGQLSREENYVGGLADGLSTEFDLKGNIIVRGEYLEGKEEGFWLYEYGDHREEGEYKAGMRSGLWKHFYPDGKKAFEGRFIEDNPHENHIWYWPDGQLKEEGKYAMGRKNGDWKMFSEDGSLLFVIHFVNGIEKKYDGIPIPDSEQIVPD